MPINSEKFYKIFNRIPFFYYLYEKTGLKDFSSGAYQLRQYLKKTGSIVEFSNFKMLLDEKSYMDLSLLKQYIEDGEYEKETSIYIKKI